MAGREVIHFPLWAQLSSHLFFRTLPPPEPAAESPPKLKFSERASPFRLVPKPSRHRCASTNGTA